MDIKFSLNDRQNSNQLSDRIISSGDEIFKEFLGNDVVQKLFMKGEKNAKNRAAANRRLTDYRQLFEGRYVGKLMNGLKQLTDDQKEKQFFDECANALDENLFSNYSTKCEQLFGKPDPSLATERFGQSLYGYLQLVSYNTANPSFLKIMAILLAMYHASQRVFDYLNSNPNYTPNDFSVIILFKELKLRPVVDRFRQMIDKRGEKVSKEEEKELTEIFCRALAYEYLILKSNYAQNQWFNG